MRLDVFSTVDGFRGAGICSIPDPFSWGVYGCEEDIPWRGRGCVNAIGTGSSPHTGGLGESHSLPSSLQLICASPSGVRLHSCCGWGQDSTFDAKIFARYGNQGVTGMQWVVRWFRPVTLESIVGGCLNAIDVDSHYIVARGGECGMIIKTYKQNKWSYVWWTRTKLF